MIIRLEINFFSTIVLLISVVLCDNNLKYSNELNLYDFNYNSLNRSDNNNYQIKLQMKFFNNNNLNDMGMKYIDENIIEDAFLLTPEIIIKYGYKCEIYTVETEDGYLLEMHRIPKPGAQPIFLMHGLLDSSSTWIIMGPTKGLAYMLADLGYDVWMGNVRGNRYSKKHRNLSPASGKFWQFSFHEIGKYDLPVFIDFVLNKTEYQKIHYVGHSQGSCVFWVLCHERPEYNEKILSMQALGPVAFTGNCKSPVVRTMEFFLNSITLLAKLIGWNEFLPKTEFLSLFSQVFCKDDVITQIMCKNVMFLITGYNEKQLNTTMLPVILGHAPAGASSRQLIHFGQLTRSGYFRQYDHGIFKNLRIYKRLTPPDYDITHTKVKVALHYSVNDWLATPQDVEKLHQKLPNLIGKFLVEDRNFNHLDFVWGIDVKEILYKKVVKIINLVEKGEI